MVYGRGPQTQTGFHLFFSTAVGGGIPICAHQHKAVELVLLLGLWVALHIFMHARARRARGVFIDEKVQEFYGLGGAGFLAGLLFVSTVMAAWPGVIR